MGGRLKSLVEIHYMEGVKQSQFFDNRVVSVRKNARRTAPTLASAALFYLPFPSITERCCPCA